MLARIRWVLAVFCSNGFVIHEGVVAFHQDGSCELSNARGAHDIEWLEHVVEDHEGSLNLLQRHASFIMQKGGREHDIKQVSPTSATISMLASPWPEQFWSWLSIEPGTVNQQVIPIMSPKEALQMERWPLLMLLILLLLCFPFTKEVMSVRSTAEQATFCTYIVQVANFISFTLVITTSYIMSRMVRADMAFSGAIIGFYMAGSGLGFFVSWGFLKQYPNLWRSHPRLVLPITVLLGLFGSVGYAATGFLVPLGVKVPLIWLRCALLMTRALAGVGQGLAAFYVRIMNVRLTPPEGRMSQGINFQFSVSLGMGLGPFLSALASIDSKEKSVSIGHGQELPIGHVLVVQHVGVLGVGLQFMALLFVLWFLPDVSNCADQVALQDGGQDRVEEQQQAMKKTEAKQVEQATEDVTVFWQKRRIVIICLVSQVLNSYLSAALESLTSLVLRVSFGWRTLHIGFAVALTFLMTVPLRLGSKYFIPESLSWKRLVCLAFHFILLVGGVLIFLSSRLDSMPLLLLSDALAFPSMVMITGMFVGQMDMFKFPESSWFNVNTRTLISGLLTNSFARSLGPIAATTIFQHSGQSGYAIQQGIIIFVMIALYVSIYSLFGYFRADLDDEDKLKSPGEIAGAAAVAARAGPAHVPAAALLNQSNRSSQKRT